jgi:hypothetical protein
VVSAFSRKLLLDPTTSTGKDEHDFEVGKISESIGPVNDFPHDIAEKGSPKAKEGEKGGGSKLKLSLHASSQEDTDGPPEEQEDPYHKLGESSKLSLRHSLRHTQEIPISPPGPLLLPLSLDLDGPLVDEIESAVSSNKAGVSNDSGLEVPASKVDLISVGVVPSPSQTLTRDREDSISHELVFRRKSDASPTLGNAEQDRDDDGDDVITAFSSHPTLPKTAQQPNNTTNTAIRNNNNNNYNYEDSSSPSQLHQRPPHQRNNSGTTSSLVSSSLNPGFSSTNIKDPFQTMYTSKYTSYGRDVDKKSSNNDSVPQQWESNGNSNSANLSSSVQRRRPNAHQHQGLQDVLRKWWVLFCILFVLSIARWLVL